MATKNLFEVNVVMHNDGQGSSPITYNTVYVLARTPSQVSSKLMKTLGDQLLFIENIKMAASNDKGVFGTPGTSVTQLVG